MAQWMLGLDRHRSSESPARRDLRWSALAWFLLTVCVVLSCTFAVLWRGQVKQQAAESFRTEAATVGASVTTALLRIDDLTMAARTAIASTPVETNGDFANWYESLGARKRYPGTLGFGFMQLVRGNGLQRYLTDVRTDPVPGFGRPPKTLIILPPGRRPYYCLVRFAVPGIANRLVPGGYGLDVCAIPGAEAIGRSIATGAVTTFAAEVNGGKALVVSAPVYWAGAVPARVAERRVRMLGWVTGVFDLDVILGRAIGSDHGLVLTVARQDTGLRAHRPDAPAQLGAVSTVATIGDPARATLRRRFTLDADGRWIVTVAERPDWGLLSPTLQAVALLSGGVAFGLVLFLLLRVLSRSRSLALRTVDEQTEQLRHQALHDALTGLPNRALVLDRIEQMLVRTRREQLPGAALFLDLDGFKTVNDTFGHTIGDDLLRAVAARLSGTLREADTVGRFGGDEFVMVVEGVSLAAGPELVAERILNVLRQPFELEAAGGVSLAVTASVGIATGDRGSAEDLLRDADIALYEAKALGKQRAVVFRQEMQVAVHDRLALEMDLRGAIRDDQLVLAYQPTFDLTEQSALGAEALLRWQHPSRGLVQPDAFIPLAEETGLILEIGEWVLAEACAQTAAWHAQGYRLEVAVNVSARQLDDPGLVDAVRSALDASGLDPAFLILEITETALMQDADATVERLAALKRLGVRIAIDDFGTGYSSLAYLQRFSVDSLKIDRSFVAGMAKSPEAKALIRTFVQLAKTLHLVTVAEGIETHDQLQQLRAERCECGQGFLLARPLEVQRMEAFLAEHWRHPEPRRLHAL